MNNGNPTGKGKDKDLSQSSSWPIEPEGPIVDDENAIDRIANRAWNYIPYEQRSQLTWGEVRFRVSSLDEPALALLYSTFGADDSNRRFRQLAETTGLAQLVGIPPLAQGGPSFTENDELLDAPYINSLLRDDLPPLESQETSTSQITEPSQSSVFTEAALNAVKPPQTVDELHKALRQNQSSITERIEDFARRYSQAIRMHEHVSEREDLLDDIMLDLYGERDALKRYAKDYKEIDDAVKKYEAARKEKADEILSLKTRWENVGNQVNAGIKAAEEVVKGLLEKQEDRKKALEELGDVDSEEEYRRHILDDVLDDIDERNAQLSKRLEQTDPNTHVYEEIEREQRFQQRQRALYEQLVRLELPFIPWKPIYSPSWAEKQAEFEKLCEDLLTHVASELRLLNQELQSATQGFDEMPEERRLLRAQLIAQETQLNLRRNTQDFPHYDFADEAFNKQQENVITLSRSLREKIPLAEQSLQSLDHRVRQLQRGIQRLADRRERLQASDSESTQGNAIQRLDEELQLANLQLDIASLQRRQAVEGETAPLAPNSTDADAGDSITIGQELRAKDVQLTETIGKKPGVKRSRLQQELDNIDNGAHRGELPDSQNVLQGRQSKKQDIALQEKQREALESYRAIAKKDFAQSSELSESTTETTREFIREESMRRIIDCNDLLKKASEELLTEEQRQNLQEELNHILQNKQFTAMLVGEVAQGRESNFLRQVSDYQQLQNVTFLGRGSDQRLYFAGAYEQYSVLYEVPEASQGMLNQQAQQQLGRENLVRGDRITFATAPRWNADNPDTYMATYVNWGLQTSIVNRVTMEAIGEQMENMVFVEARPNGNLIFARLEQGFPVAYEFPPNTQGQIAQQAQLQLGRPLESGDRLTFTTAARWNTQESNWNQTFNIDTLVNQGRINTAVASDLQQLDSALFLGGTPGETLRFAVLVEGYPLVYEVPPSLQGQINQQARQQLMMTAPLRGDRLTFRCVPPWNFQQPNTDQAAHIGTLIEGENIDVTYIPHEQRIANAIYIGTTQDSELLFATFTDNYPVVHALPPTLQGQIDQAALHQLGRTALQAGDQLTFHALPAWNMDMPDVMQADDIARRLALGFIHRTPIQANEQIENGLFIGEDVHTDSFLLATVVEGYPVVRELPNTLQGQIAQETHRRYGRIDLREGDRLTFTAVLAWDRNRSNVDQANHIAAALQDGSSVRVNDATSGQELSNVLFIEERPNGNLLFAEFAQGYPIVHELPSQLHGQIAQSAQRQLRRTDLQAGDLLTTFAVQHWQGEINFNNVAMAMANGTLPLADIAGEHRMENALFVYGDRGENMGFAVLEHGYPILYDIPNAWQGQMAQAIRLQFGDEDFQHGDMLTFHTAPHWNANLGDATQANAIADTLRRNAIHVTDVQENQRLENALFIDRPGNGALHFAAILEGYPLIYRLPPALQGQVTQQTHRQLGRADLQAGDRLTFWAVPLWNNNLSTRDQITAIGRAIRHGIMRLNEPRSGQPMAQALITGYGAASRPIFAIIEHGYPATYFVPRELAAQVGQQALRQLGRRTLQPGDRFTFVAAPHWDHAPNDIAEATRIMAAHNQGLILPSVINNEQQLQQALYIGQAANGHHLFATHEEDYPVIHEVPHNMQGDLAFRTDEQLGRGNLQPGDRLTFTAAQRWNAIQYTPAEANTIAALLNQGRVPNRAANNPPQLQNALFIRRETNGNLLFATLQNGYPVVDVVTGEWQRQIAAHARRQLRRLDLRPGDQLTFATRQWVPNPNNQTEANNILQLINNGTIPNENLLPTAMGNTLQNAMFITQGQGRTLIFAVVQPGMEHPQIWYMPHNQQGGLTQLTQQLFGRNRLQQGDVIPTFTTQIHRTLGTIIGNGLRTGFRKS